MGNRSFFALCCTEICWNGAVERSLSDWFPVSESLQTEYAIHHPSLHHLACYVGECIRAYATVRVGDDGIFALEHLVVDPNVYGQGLGSCLLAFTEKFIRVRKGIRIDAHIPREAQTFFEKMGYCLIVEWERTSKARLSKML